MCISRSSQALGLLMILFSISAIHYGVSGARLLTEKVEEVLAKPPVWSKSSENMNGDEGFFATINREVPTCPDPLHNR
ncbi:hypothetical protein FNV43_RR04907 [Rhamnella rubrinervis]|uniref:Uncharacterized protein n=1 Tax=Rhamnella rubrinervis TaxID=2594499 RepID=A0A8K0MR30_9ROSA|nr:hypothetical protein FNV43_RR04907 [Rhamnella rubrinervis]